MKKKFNKKCPACHGDYERRENKLSCPYCLQGRIYNEHDYYSTLAKLGNEKRKQKNKPFNFHNIDTCASVIFKYLNAPQIVYKHIISGVKVEEQKKQKVAEVLKRIENVEQGLVHLTIRVRELERDCVHKFGANTVIREKVIADIKNLKRQIDLGVISIF